MSRRIATDADLKIGTVVYKGNGKVAYKVWRINAWTPGSKFIKHPTTYCLQKVTSNSAPASKGYRSEALQIDAPAAQAEPTGMDTLRDLLSLD